MWGKIQVAVLIAGILGGISLAFAQTGTNGEVKTKIENIEQSGKDATQRLEKVEGKIDDVQKTIGDMRVEQARQQAENSTKLDILLSGKKDDLTPAR